MKLPHKIWKVKLDMLPVNSNEVMLPREYIIMLILGGEEKEYEGEQKNSEDELEKCASTLRISQSQYVKDSIIAFKIFDATAKKTAKSFTYKLGPKDINSVEWKMLGNNKEITACPMEKNAKEKKKVRTSTGQAMRCVCEESKHCIHDESSNSAYKCTYAHIDDYAYV